MPVDESSAVVKDEPKQFPLVPNGIYTVEIVDVSLLENVDTKWGKKDYYRFYMGVINSGENRGYSLWHKVSKSYNSGYDGGNASALYKLHKAIEDVDVKSVNVNSFIGKRVQVFVKQEKSNKGVTYSNIKEVMPVDINSANFEPLTESEKNAIVPKQRANDLSEIDDNDLPSFDDVVGTEEVTSLE